MIHVTMTNDTAADAILTRVIWDLLQTPVSLGMFPGPCLSPKPPSIAEEPQNEIGKIRRVCGHFCVMVPSGTDTHTHTVQLSVYSFPYFKLLLSN